MTSKLFVLIFIGMGFSNLSFAGQVCAKNGQEIMQQKDSFPRFLQSQQEIQFARSDSPVAYLKVAVTPSKILGEAKYKVPVFGVKQERSSVSQLCYNKETREMKIDLTNGNDFKVKVISESAVTIKGQTMTRSPSEYQKAVAILNGTNRASVPASAARTTNNGGAQ